MQPHHWILLPEDLPIIKIKNPANRINFALLLLHYRKEKVFPDDFSAIPAEIIEYIAQQLEQPANVQEKLNLSLRTRERNKAEIRAMFGYREWATEDAQLLMEWLQNYRAIIVEDTEQLKRLVEKRCNELKIELPAKYRIDRIVQSAIAGFEAQFYDRIYELVPTLCRQQLDELLLPLKGDISLNKEQEPALLLSLRANPSRPSLASIQDELNKLALIRQIELPAGIFDTEPVPLLERYRKHVQVEEPYELRRHPEKTRITWLAIFIHLRSRTLVDGLVDLLIETIHHIGARAERRVDRELLEDIKKVTGKHNLLFELAGATLANPDGVVREVIFPVVKEQTLRDLVREWKSTGPVYKNTLRTVIRNSYKGHYRRIIPQVLAQLEFRSNNEHHRPVIEALELLKRYRDSKQHYFPAEEQVPLDGILRGLWRDAVMEVDANGRIRINRITYEICVLEALREKLRCKEIWVVGANRYRNPDEDLPVDFEIKREVYYQELKLPENARQFITSLQADMNEALTMLDVGLPGNRWVKIKEKGGGWITLTPLEPQPAPENIAAIKSRITATWPMTSLLDIVKETDLRLGFTDAFKSLTSHESMDRGLLRSRLLLCLHGLGTNTGLQRMATPGNNNTSHKELTYVRHRYISTEALRQAVAIVTNGTFAVRNPAIWGNGSTACASDSKHFGAWDQNLTTQWHVRYGGRGIMIYWHVERKSLCIHSQLKSPASSEVAAMIEGVLHHCTEMEVDRQYVDSHGQSTIAFAFCHLLGFKLLPRLKAIHVQKLYRPDLNLPGAFPNLQPIIKKHTIDWELIGQQYDQMVKYATALRLGTAEPEAILRRFIRSNVQHPTYKALSELGKAVKTVFLCQYLHDEVLRREIQEGLNVVEQWNGATDFVFFARKGELNSNRKEDHEASMLSLHLLQNCMVYINTLMLQQVLDQVGWVSKLTERDLSALTPLFWEHINPYGRFELDMSTRLPIENYIF